MTEENITTKIVGIGAYIPKNIITNEDLSKIVDTGDDWISRRTGIKERCQSVNGTTNMAVYAAKEACEDAGVQPEELDIIIVATSTGDYHFPSTACEVQRELGAFHAFAFDITAACSGFIFALNTIHTYFLTGKYKTGLVIGAETLSKLVDWKDRSTCILFGDGAGATVVQRAKSGIIGADLGSDGTKASVLTCKGREIRNLFIQEKSNNRGIKMEGKEVFKFATKKVPESIRSVLHKTGIKAGDIKYYILHQANERIIQMVAKYLNEPLSKFPINLQRYGNTSAASIPLLLDEIKKTGRLNKGDKIILSGFGAGLTWGSILLEW